MGCAGSIEQASRPVERKTQQDVSIRKVSGSAKVTPEVEPPSARRKSERPSPGVAQQNGDPSVSKNSNRGGHRRESVDDVQEFYDPLDVSLNSPVGQAGYPKVTHKSALECAVSVAWLKSFALHHVYSKPNGRDMTTREVVEHIIKPHTNEVRCRYVDAGLVPEDHVGKPDYFISHAWDNPFSLMVDSVCQWLGDSALSHANVWIDCFAINQHDVTGPCGDKRDPRASGSGGPAYVHDPDSDAGSEIGLERGQLVSLGPDSPDIHKDGSSGPPTATAAGGGPATGADASIGSGTASGGSKVPRVSGGDVSPISRVSWHDRLELNAAGGAPQPRVSANGKAAAAAAAAQQAQQDAAGGATSGGSDRERDSSGRRGVNAAAAASSKARSRRERAGNAKERDSDREGDRSDREYRDVGGNSGRGHGGAGGRNLAHSNSHSQSTTYSQAHSHSHSHKDRDHGGHRGRAASKRAAGPGDYSGNSDLDRERDRDRGHRASGSSHHHNSNPQQPQRSELSAVKQAIRHASATLLCLDKSGMPLQRLWCLWECDCTVHIKGHEKLVLLRPGFTMRDLANTIAELDVEDASCSHFGDKRILLDDIKRHHGSSYAFNTALKLLLLLNPLDYTHDLSTLVHKAAASKQQQQLMLQQQQLQQQMQQQQQQAAGVAGGAPVVPPPSTSGSAPPSATTAYSLNVPGSALTAGGTAASTAAPANNSRASGTGDPELDTRSIYQLDVLWGKLSQQSESESQQVPAVALIVAGAGEGKSTVSAALMSEKPCRVHAYHLCKYGDLRRQDPVRLVRTLAYQLGMSFPKVAKQYLALKFEDIRQLHNIEKAFEVLLLKPLQVLGDTPVTLLLDAVDEGDSTSSGDPRLHPGSLFTNTALQLLLLFSQMPRSVRIVVTTSRQDHILGCIRYKFPACAELHPSQLRLHDNFSYHLQAMLAKYLPPDQVPVWMEGMIRNGGNTMLYNSVVLHILEQQQQQSARVSGGLHAAGLPGALSSSGGGGRDSSDGIWLDSPPTDLGAAYAHAFRQRWAGLSAAQRSAVKALIQVMLAAQEPLPMHLLVGLRLQQLLHLLPAWGVLFHMADHQVYAMHKSLTDWLQDPNRSAEFYVDTRVGHEIIGKYLFHQAVGRQDLSIQPTTYALKYTVTHLIMARGRSCAQLVDRAVLDFDFLQHVYTAGHGSGLFMALSQMDPRSAVVDEVLRWLQLDGPTMRATPEAVLQLARDTPSQSLICQASFKYYRQPTAYQLVKDEAWPAQISMLEGHMIGVTDVSFSPDGSRLASASDDKTVRLWDTFSGQQLASLAGHTAAVTCVCYSPDGSRVASASFDKTARLWDASNGLQVLVLKGHTNGVTGVAFNKKGDRLATASWDFTVRLWDAGNAQQLVVYKGHTHGITSVAFDPIGDRLVSGSYDKTLRIWDMNTGTSLAVLEGHTHWVTCVCYSPDGNHIVSASFDKTVRLWDAASHSELAFLQGHTDSVMYCVFSPDADLLATTSDDKTVRLWNAYTGKHLATFQGHTARVNSVCFHPRYPLLASSSDDKTIRMWDTSSRPQEEPFAGHTDTINSVCFSPDGDIIASCSRDKTARLWDPRTGRQLAVLEGHRHWVTCVCFSPLGDRVASASYDNTIKIWNTKNGAHMLTLKGHTDRVTSVCFNPFGDQLISASHDMSLRLWDAINGVWLATLEGHHHWITSVAISHKGDMLASASWDKTVRLWDVHSGQLQMTLAGHTKTVTAVCFSPSGEQLASASWDKTIRLWDARTGICEYTLQEAAFIPDMYALFRKAGFKLWIAALSNGSGLGTGAGGGNSLLASSGAAGGAYGKDKEGYGYGSYGHTHRNSSGNGAVDSAGTGGTGGAAGGNKNYQWGIGSHSTLRHSNYGDGSVHGGRYYSTIGSNSGNAGFRIGPPGAGDPGLRTQLYTRLEVPLRSDAVVVHGNVAAISDGQHLKLYQLEWM